MTSSGREPQAATSPRPGAAASTDGDRQSSRPENFKAWFDDNLVLHFRNDVSAEETRELELMLTDAFHRGLASGYQQGKAAR